MTDPVARALSLWGMQDARWHLAARRENAVWRVSHGNRDHALRFHRAGYRTMPQLQSELDWTAALARGGLSVPTPSPLPNGELVGAVDGQAVSLLSWMPGRPVGAQSQLQDIADPVGFCQQLGAMMARMHDLTDAWPQPPDFTRPDWRRDGLLGEAPLWGRFWDHPHLTAEQRTLLLDCRARADAELRAIEANLDQGLIHADLLTENIMIHGDTLTFIDFDDGAYGFRDFELATFLMKFLDHPEYTAMRAALCAGYAARRTVAPAHLDLFLLLRALTYPGWIITRLSEPGAAERSARAIKTAVALATRYLNRRSL